MKLNIDLLLLPPFKKNRVLVFLIHWMAWLLLHFITFLPTFVNMKNIVWEPFLFTHIVLVSLNAFLFYVVAFHIAPLLSVLRSKWFWMLISSLLLCIIFTYLKFRLEAYHTQYLLENIPAYKSFSRRPSQESLGFFSYRFRTYFQGHILINVSVVVVGFAYRLLLIWFQQERIRTKLENQKLQAELSFLKMQVNPHFLFNALNNIYSLAVLENSNKTGNSILKLSELMRYMLYEKEDKENKVSLDKEIRHINSYIDLERLRHPGNTYVNFSIEGDINGRRIAPLLLFPLIENAFKHGLITDPDKPVNIELKITDQRINFSIENYNNNYSKDDVGGIGVQNVKKRLDLLYGKNYSFNIDHSNDRYVVNLNLPL